MRPVSLKLDATNHNSNYSRFSKLIALTLIVTLKTVLLSGQSKLSQQDLAFSRVPSPILFANRYMSSADNTYAVTELSFNTAADEYATCMYQKSLVVVSNRKLNRRTILGQSDYKLLGFTQQKSTWSVPYLLPGVFTGKTNHGGITFNKNGTQVFFTKTLSTPNTYALFTAHKSTSYNHLWRDEKQIIVAASGFSIENPWLSTDGKLLYFSSNMPGGFGGYDLYAVQVFKNGVIGKPYNLGEQINSSANENFPSLNPDNTQLYFASDRKESIGGYDIFYAFTDTKSYSAPKNMGTTINSSSNEIRFIPTSSTSGYFSSNKNSLSRTMNVYAYEKVAAAAEFSTSSQQD